MAAAEDPLAPACAEEERVAVDMASGDAAKRLRGKVMASLSCKEAERLLDGNFRVNDEVCSALRAAWDCAVRLEAQLGEADRPWEERNRWLQDLAAERGELADLEATLLTAKLEVQTACASATGFQASRFAQVLEENVTFRARCARLGRQLESVVQSARRSLRMLGERPDVRPESEAAGMARRWRLEFDAASDVVEAMLRSLRHPEAATAVAATSLEHALDHSWRFVLELVGLIERLLDGLEGEVRASAESLRDRLESSLPQLLEAKLQVQDAASRGQPQDVATCTSALTEAQSGQVASWKLLTANAIDLSSIVPTKFAEEMLPHPAAFGTAPPLPTERAADFPPVLRLLTYNLFLRAPAPQFTHNTDNDRKDERLCRFVEHLARYDLLCLQEVYGAFSQRRDWLINVAKRFGLKDSYRSSTGVRPRFIVDGGLLILSRLPIVFKSSLTFDPGTSLDRFSAKGALYAKVQCGPTGPFLHVCTTHLQSTYSEDSLQSSQAIRHKQLMSLVNFLREQTDDTMSETGKSRRRWPLLLCGTLNFNGRRGLMDGGHSAEYRAVMQLLRDELGEVRDLLFDVCGTHPVTYADTRLTGNGEVPVERVLTNAHVYNSDVLKRQCLDYMFFFPYCPAQDAEENEEDASMLEPVVPATCHVEKFAVDRSKDVGAPVTQLSDHYGVEATLAVIESPAYLAAERPTQRSRGFDPPVLSRGAKAADEGYAPCQDGKAGTAAVAEADQSEVVAETSGVAKPEDVDRDVAGVSAMNLPQSGSDELPREPQQEPASSAVAEVLEAVAFEADTDITDDPNPNTVEACAAE
ncbi:unnamed protein product [Symbiodinium sp. CCMP2456]|nr:unnamed protein product [Symbiodinium sp. CCMP2456]